MSYLENARSQRHYKTAAVVLMIEAGIGWALVSGLVGNITRTFTQNPTATNIKLTPPKQPEKDHTPVRSDPRPTLEHPPETRPELIPTTGPVFTPDFSDHGDTGAIGEVEFPTRPIAPPAPHFIPKSPRARGKAGLWVTPNDYPSSELRLEHQGTTRFAVTVGSDGKPKACTVTGSSGWPLLDAAACAKIMARAAFDPATGSDGEKTVGTWNSAVQWQIPE